MSLQVTCEDIARRDFPPWMMLNKDNPIEMMVEHCCTRQVDRHISKASQKHEAIKMIFLCVLFSVDEEHNEFDTLLMGHHNHRG